MYHASVISNNCVSVLFLICLSVCMKMFHIKLGVLMDTVCVSRRWERVHGGTEFE